jgi:hypothetical protein
MSKGRVLLIKIMKFFGTTCHASAALKIAQVNWLVRPKYWFKCNTDGTFRGSTGLSTGVESVDIFRDFRALLWELLLIILVFQIQILFLLN